MAARKNKQDRIDPTWHETDAGDHPVSEFLADRQGSLSPFGNISFPMSEDNIPYQHPETKINK